MPVEIRELVIKATVAEEMRTVPVKGVDEPADAGDRRALVHECANLVMELLNRLKER